MPVLIRLQLPEKESACHAVFFKLVFMKQAANPNIDQHPSRCALRGALGQASHQGQSLIESLFVLFIIAMLCGTAATSMQMLMTRIDIQSASEEMLSAVLTARTEALRRERRVTLCVAAPVANVNLSAENPLPIACATSGISATSWQQGWLMFEDVNNNGLWDVGEVLLQQHAALKAPISATGNATVSRYVSFGASGRSLALNGAFQAGTITFCEHKASAGSAWLLVVNAVGRPRLDKVPLSSCS